MASRIDKIHKAVLWMSGGNDNYGRSTVDLPLEIDCRWVEDKIEGLDNQGAQVAFDGEVVVHRDIEIGSILRLGALCDLPETPDNLYTVIRFNKTANTKGTKYRRTVLIQRYGNTLPDSTGLETDE